MTEQAENVLPEPEAGSEQAIPERPAPLSVDQIPRPKRQEFNEEYVDKYSKRLAEMPNKQADALSYGRLSLAEYSRHVFRARVPAGTTPDDVVQPSFWKHHLRELNASVSNEGHDFPKIEVICEDGSWEGMYRVMYIGEAEVIVSPIYYAEHDSSEGQSMKNSPLEVVWKGPIRRFCVRNKDSGEFVAENLFPKERALKYVSDRGAK